MPFLSIFKKQSFPEVDHRLLAKLAGSSVETIRFFCRGSSHHILSDLCLSHGHDFRSRLGQPGVANGAWFRVISTSDAVEIGRDHFGMMPLWCVETDEYVAVSPASKWFAAIAGFRPRLRSEEDLIAATRRPVDFSPFENVARLSPTKRVRLDARGITAMAPVASVRFPKAVDLEPDEYAQSLGDALWASAIELPRVDEWTCLLSGGVDSSIAASLVRGRATNRVRAVSLGTLRGNEFSKAEATARELGIACSRVMCTGRDLLASFEDVVWHNEVFDGLTAETLAQMNILVRSLMEADLPGASVVTGYGADLLLGGMMQHEAYLEAVGVSSESQLVERTMWTNEFSPLFAWKAGVRLHHLFWHPRVHDAALRIPTEINMVDGHQKYLLRRVACDRGWLPASRAFDGKLGLTDGTQAHELLSEALGLGPGYNHAKKTQRALNVFRTRLEAACESR